MTQQQQPQPKPSPDRGAQIIQLAVQILAAGQARGWSDAVSQARKQVK